jgi:hypothetical protein
MSRYRYIVKCPGSATFADSPTAGPLASPAQISLAVLTALRARLIDELGIEPVAELGDVYLAILRSDPAVHAHPPGSLSG